MTQILNVKGSQGLFVAIVAFVILAGLIAGTLVIAKEALDLFPQVVLDPDCAVDGDARVVNECRGTLDPERQAWEEAYVQSETSITVTFTGGAGPFWVFDHVEIVEDSQTVILSLFEGYDPAYARYARSHPNGSYGLPACLAVGIPRETIVELDSPLDGRVVIDGKGFPKFCAIKSIHNGQEVWLSQGYSQPCIQP